MSSQVVDPRFEEIAPTEPRERKEGRGCFFWGCLFAAILFLVALIGIPLMIYFGIRSYVHAYTSDAPAEIAVVELPEEQLAEITARFEAFTEALEGDVVPPELELTADELNGLINQNEDLAGKVFVRIEDGKIGGDVSFPLDDFPIPGAGGRYFNASVEFDVSMENGDLDVFLVDGEVNGAKIPAQILGGLASEDLAKEMDDEPDVEKVLRKFDSIEIVGDKIILRPKAVEPAAERTEGDAEVGGEIESFEEAAEPVGVE